MSKNKWQRLHERYHSKEDEGIIKYGKYFEENIFNYLTQEHNPEGEKNQPGKIIQEAKSTLGKLSRILDAFDFPVLSYEEIKEISSKPNGLRAYMQEYIDEILPVLLNDEHSGLNDRIIEAIGEENYHAILESPEVNGNSEEVAMQFVKASMLSYGQRVLDKIEDEHLKVEAFNSFLPSMENLAKDISLKGLADEKKKMDLVDLHKILLNFKALMNEATEQKINIPSSDVINSNLDTALYWLDPHNEDIVDLPVETKHNKATEQYDKAVKIFLDGAENALQTSPSKPQVNFFVRVVRFLTGNEQLLQSKDEKRYERQRTLISNLNDLKSKLENSEELEQEQPHEDSSFKP
ncbi:hypothetical protein [Legionella spiritensis]|uniref:Uncharacterized protein n=1 Tax=Legionella spiritensis TaxID=452 RepID=A0A0W0YYS4_LEGSP|nr:hypothetical protein [Legionella spiritensis]KTD61654.1 hypothetical protein Lspi_2284 [Legionella spiritensis]SNV39128.1 Uncharacterised protein [Legionella spiritensis]